LLSSVNVAIGFIGVWQLAGRFVKADARLLSVLLLTFMPYYNYMASNFNANTVLLSLWPWTVFAFIGSLEKRTMASAALFGALAGVCLLSKYYSILLLASCFASSLLHPEARRYYASTAPYVAVIVAALVISPHAWWGLSNDFPTVKYALSKTGQTRSYNSYRALIAGLAGIGLNLLAAAIFVMALGWRRPALRGDARHKILAPERRWLLVLAVGPLLLTLALGAIGYLKVLLNFLIPIFFMAPLILLIAFEQAITAQSVRSVIRAVVIFMVGSMAVAPVAAYTTFAIQLHGTSEISPEAARDAARHWHEASQQPLKIVSGSEQNSLAQIFCDSDRPVEFMHFDFGHAPWITVDRINREGLLAICDDDDVVCIDKAQRYAHAGTRRVDTKVGKTVFGIEAPKQGLVYIMTPPRP
jgi:Dolichyl-phosphate-mannose-protein mannosyltransferase